ncbi:hypothetical protein DV736_g1726, partial [Chaetothyriales sp. CBS 134916]
MPLQPRRGQPNRRANVWTARIIPVFLLGIVAYSSWVLTDRVCVGYLLRSDHRRYGPAIAILVIFYLLLLIVLVTYSRLITTVIARPGVVPRGSQYYVEKERKVRRARSSLEKDGWDSGSSEGYGKLPKSRRDGEASSGEDFWHKDLFVCQYDGRPPFCSQCHNYKPTRSHHCSELERCVLKMDHFCPWIGGIVSETSFKYFILFTFWTTLLTLHVLVVMAFFFAERRGREPGFVVDVHWVLVLALAALFSLFSGGMCLSSLQFAFLNTTTIENLSRRSHVWYLAIYIPEPVLRRYRDSGRSDLRLIVYPRPPAEQLLVLQQSSTDPSMGGAMGGGSGGPEELPGRGVPTPVPQAQTHADANTTSHPNRPADVPQQSPPLTRTFAIVETKPGANPFDIGYWNNFKEVMGYTVLDWFLPLRPSPCGNHDDPHCMYKTGRVVDQLKREAGIFNNTADGEEHTSLKAYSWNLVLLEPYDVMTWRHGGLAENNSRSAIGGASTGVLKSLHDATADDGCSVSPSAKLGVNTSKEVGLVARFSGSHGYATPAHGFEPLLAHQHDTSLLIIDIGVVPLPTRYNESVEHRPVYDAGPQQIGDQTGAAVTSAAWAPHIYTLARAIRSYQPQHARWMPGPVPLAAASTMADNRYRKASPPGTRHYYTPRSSATTVFSSSFDPKYSRSSLDPHPHNRHTSIYEAQPSKRYSYQDSSRGLVSTTHYTVRPRTNSTVQTDSRRPLSMLVQNSSPSRNPPVVSNSVRDDYRGSVVTPSGRNESSRYLVPAASHGHKQHQRHYSATRAEIDRLPSSSRSGGGALRPRSEYHNAGGYNASTYSSSRVKDDDFSYTGPREQFARDYPSRPPDRRDSVSRRDRPVSIYEVTGYKDGASGRRDLAPPAAATRQLDRLDRSDGGRANGRPTYESEPEWGSELVQRRHSVKAPVVHQILEGDPRDYSHRDDYEARPRIRRDRIEEDHPTRPRVERVPVDDVQPRPRKERADDDLPVRYKNDRFDDDGPSRLRKERYLDDEPAPRPRREHVIDADLPASGHGRAVAAGLGGLAAAGLAGTALKNSQKAEDILDGDSRKDKKHRRHKHHDDDDDRGLRDQGSASDRKAPIDANERAEERRRGVRRDDSESESLDDGREQQRHRRHKHGNREHADIEPASQSSGGQDSGWPDGTPFEDDDPSRRRRRASRAREEDPGDLERRTLSPGDDEDNRPRRVQLVEPSKEKEEFRPKGILKAPRTVPFPEDPNPTREGVAPLKDAGKDGAPPGARWTKISRVLVNPEALQKAQERFEEREDYVIVLRVVSREEIEKFAEKTREIRANREREWQEDLERQHAKRSINPPEPPTAPEDEEVHQETLPLLDQVPANPSVDPRVFTNPDNLPASAAPTAVPVPNVKLENVETANYSSNV